MDVKEQYKDDIDFIMSQRHVNGGDLWADTDRHIGKGTPFSTKDVALILTEVGFNKQDLIMQDIAQLIFEHQRPDGRFKISKSGAIYPCHTIGCLRTLCYLGYSDDQRLIKTVDYLLSIQENDGGWKCNKFSFGRGPETEHANPGPTLEALDALRFTDIRAHQQQVDKAVDFLLWHWEHKQPVGPCMFGIGSLFNKTEYPFFRYNLFYYVFVLSFYRQATNDRRFQEAYQLLESKVQHGKIIVENPNRKLAGMSFCHKGQPSDLATKRLAEIRNNL